MIRTQDAGALTQPAHVGQTVTLAGWVGRRRDHGGVAFIDLRDASGVAQVVVRDEEQFHQLRNEYVLQVTGTVERRPEGNENPNLPSGEVEVMVDELTVLNTAAPLPFQIDEHVEVGEEARLKYRYLDLRREGPGHAIRLRSKVNAAARGVLELLPPFDRPEAVEGLEGVRSARAGPVRPGPFRQGPLAALP